MHASGHFTWWGAHIDATFTPTTELSPGTGFVILTAEYVPLPNTNSTQTPQSGRTLALLQNY